jgi:hypothetical protein
MVGSKMFFISEELVSIEICCYKCLSEISIQVSLTTAVQSCLKLKMTLISIDNATKMDATASALTGPTLIRIIMISNKCYRESYQSFRLLDIRRK